MNIFKRKKYYFVSYAFKVNENGGISFGTSYMTSINRYFTRQSMENTIKEDLKFYNVVIFYYKRVSKSEADANNKYYNSTQSGINEGKIGTNITDKV